MLTNCLICGQPLSEGEASINRHWHLDCEVCQFCGNDLHHSNTRIQQYLDSKVAVSHLVCASKDKIREIREKIIPYTIEHLQSVNNLILTMRHEVNPQETDLKQLYDILHEAQDLASNASILISATKDKIRIESSIEYTEKVKTERRAKAADDAEDNNKKALRQAERENPWLRDKRKAIQGVVTGFGFSLEAATTMIEEQMRKQGKDPATGQPQAIQ